MSHYTIRIKIIYNDTARILRIDQNATWDEISDIIMNKFDLISEYNAISLSYIDSDNDEIILGIS